MHDVRDPPDDDRAPEHGPARGRAAPTFVTDVEDTVGFLDAPDADLDELVAAVVAAFDRLADGAILTVHSRRTDVHSALSLMRDDHRIVVIASIPHPSGGTTLTLRR